MKSFGHLSVDVDTVPYSDVYAPARADRRHVTMAALGETVEGDDAGTSYMFGNGSEELRDAVLDGLPTMPHFLPPALQTKIKTKHLQLYLGGGWVL